MMLIIRHADEMDRIGDSPGLDYCVCDEDPIGRLLRVIGWFASLDEAVALISTSMSA